jgi:hypothetical protein
MVDPPKATAHDRGLNACREKRDAALRAVEDEGRLTQDEATGEGMMAGRVYVCEDQGWGGLPKRGRTALAF